MRIALGVEYDGSRFHGWQRQHHARTVQGELEAALGVVADTPVNIICAGRTDSGVHACHQVVHFDTDAPRSERSWVLGANSNMSTDVSVLWARVVPEHFHARFSARSRVYDYLILNRQARAGLWQAKVTWECRPLDPERMRVAAQHWIGEHDFSSFRARDCQAAHAVRTVFRFDVIKDSAMIVLRVSANAFLQHMVRNFAGVLIEIGTGRKPPAWAGEVLAYRERERGGVTAPPHGLYLSAVEYPKAFDLPCGNAPTPRLPAYTGPGFSHQNPI